MAILNPLSQKIFAVKEDAAGTLQFPTAGHAHHAPSLTSIIGAGYVSANRSVSFTDSPEIRDSLNLRDQVKDRDAAGEWSVPILVRPSGRTGTAFHKPMGHTLLECLIGRDMQGDTGSLNEVSGITASTDEFTVDNLEFRPKAPCVISIGSELMYIKHIDSIVADTDDATKYQAEFYVETRGYDGTIAAIHSDGAEVEVRSHTYSQTTSRNSFSLWFQRDTIVYFCGGATVASMSYTGESKGYPGFELNGGFMTLGWAGRSTLIGAHSIDDTVLQLGTGEARLYSIGARIYNFTTDDYINGSDYYVITDIDYDNHTLTINTPLGVTGTGISTAWADQAIIAGYLPDTVSIGSTLKSEDTVVRMGDSTAAGTAPTLLSKTPTAINISFDSPIKYIEEEITPDAISEYTEERRSISGSITQLMSNAELVRFYMADQDEKQAIQIQLGADTVGYKCLMTMRRCTVQVPKENISEPLVEQSMDYTAIDDDIEDSFVFSIV